MYFSLIDYKDIQEVLHSGIVRNMSKAYCRGHISNDPCTKFIIQNHNYSHELYEVIISDGNFIIP